MTAENTTVTVSVQDDVVSIRPAEAAETAPRWRSPITLFGAFAEMDVRDGALSAKIFDAEAAAWWLPDVFGEGVADSVDAHDTVAGGSAVEASSVASETSPRTAALRRFALAHWLRARTPNDVHTSVNGRELRLPAPAIWLLDLELAVLADQLEAEMGDRVAAADLLVPRLPILARELTDAVEGSSFVGGAAHIARTMHHAALLAEDLEASGFLDPGLPGFEDVLASLARYSDVQRVVESEAPSDTALQDLMYALTATIEYESDASWLSGDGTTESQFGAVDWSQVHPRQLSASDDAIEWVVTRTDGVNTISVSVDPPSEGEREPVDPVELYARCDCDGTPVFIALRDNGRSFVGSAALPDDVSAPQVGVSVFSDVRGTGEYLGDNDRRRGELLAFLAERMIAALDSAEPESTEWDRPFAFEYLSATTGFRLR